MNYIPTGGRRPRLRLFFPFSDKLSIKVRGPRRHVRAFLNNQHLAPRSSRIRSASRRLMSMAMSARFRDCKLQLTDTEIRSSGSRALKSEWSIRCTGTRIGTWNVLHRWMELFSVYTTCRYGLLNIPQRFIVLPQSDGFDCFTGIPREANVDS